MARIARLQPVDFSVAAAPKSTFGQVAGAAFEREQLVGEMGSRNTFDNEVYEPFIGFFNNAIRPMAPDLFAHGIENSARAPNNSPISLETFQAIQDQNFHPDEETLGRFISELDAAGIEYPDDISPSVLFPRKQDAEKALSEKVRDLDRTMAQAGTATSIGGQFAGGFMAGLDNIESVATMPIGATARAGIVATALIEGAVNAAAEAATTPLRNEFLNELGLEEESLLANAGMGFAVGGAVGGGLRSVRALGTHIRDKRALAALAERSPDRDIRDQAQALRRDADDEEAAVSDGDPLGIKEHEARVTETARAAVNGEAPAMPDRPTFAAPSRSILGGEIEEVSPRDLLVQPDVFQFKSNTTGSAGVTGKLSDISEWRSERAGIVLVYEYADGSRAIADGHQRTDLANRIMDAGGDDIKMAARVFREVDGFSPEDIRVLAALKNISEAADGMTTAMARDAARVLRISPEAIADLPSGPGIARAQSLSKLSDDAFSMFINEVVPERFAELVGRMVPDRNMHAPMMQLLRRAGPQTTDQAESILSQALQAPVSREVTADLFGEAEITQSLYLERAQVLERAMKLMREDRTTFRTLDERADQIQGTGKNRLDQQSNKAIREQTEAALVAVKVLAHRSGPISEALNNGAKAYKENGRIKDAAQAVVAAVREEIERNGLYGAGSGTSQRAAQSAGASRATPDPLEAFSDPVNGEGAKAQIEATRIQPTPAATVVRLAEMSRADAVRLDAELRAGQDIKDIEDLMERGARNHADLTSEIAQVAQEVGVTARAAPLKGRERTEAKINGKYAGDVNRVTDVARGGVDALTPEAAEAFVERLSRRYRIIDEGWHVVDAGYFDRKLTVIFDDGQLGEVQMWVPGMFEVKEAKGHKLYEIYRDASQPEAARAKALADMEELYSGVMESLPPQWAEVVGATPGGKSAPNAETTAANSSRSTSGDPSSPKTSEGSMGSQAPDADSKSITPGSGSNDGIELSAKKKRMNGTSNSDLGNNGQKVNSEKTDAGEQTLFPGVEPVTARQRLDQLAAKPMSAKPRASDTEIGGLFDPLDPARVDLFDVVPVGRGFDEDGNEVALFKSRADIAAELDADDEAVDILDICVKG